MITIKTYNMVTSLDEAYRLNQVKSNAVLGGMIWMKMGTKAVNVGIDLSNLGLDTITEDTDSFSIGAMVTLRQLETHAGFCAQFGQAVHESMRHIVGVQLRNTATVGGSVYMRFGFSDVLTLLLALHAKVELYQVGVMPLADYAAKPYDRDIVVRVIVPKSATTAVHYDSMRNTATDLPVLTCAVAKDADGYFAVVGGRPHRALVVRDTTHLHGDITPQAAQNFADLVKQTVTFGSNERASGAYRKHLCGVLVQRGVQSIAEGEATWKSN